MGLQDRDPAPSFRLPPRWIKHPKEAINLLSRMVGYPHARCRGRGQGAVDVPALSMIFMKSERFGHPDHRRRPRCKEESSNDAHGMSRAEMDDIGPLSAGGVERFEIISGKVGFRQGGLSLFPPRTSRQIS